MALGGLGTAVRPPDAGTDFADGTDWADGVGVASTDVREFSSTVGEVSFSLSADSVTTPTLSTAGTRSVKFMSDQHCGG